MGQRASEKILKHTELNENVETCPSFLLLGPKHKEAVDQYGQAPLRGAHKAKQPPYSKTAQRPDRSPGRLLSVCWSTSTPRDILRTPSVFQLVPDL